LYQFAASLAVGQVVTHTVAFSPGPPLNFDPSATFQFSTRVFNGKPNQ
jgi:hypothetical protein